MSGHPSPSAQKLVDAIWVDADALREDSLRNLLDLTYAMPGASVHVFGVRSVIGAWRNALKSTPSAEVLATPVAATGATVVALSAAAVAAAREAAGQRWLVIGAARGYLALAHALAGCGIRAERHASLTGDVLDSLICAGDLLAASLRSLYLEMREGKSHRVHVGALANEAVRRWPDLEDLNIRTRLFGARRFAPLFKAVGLVVDGDDVVGI